MKKNYLFRTAMCLGVVTMMSLCMTAGTYAKYVTTLTGTADSARVAKFAFDITAGANPENKVNQASSAIKVELFNSAFEMDSKTADEDLKTTDGTLVCPGTWGYVPISIENKSEVDVLPAFTITADPAGVPLQLCVVTAEPTKAPASGGGVTWTSISGTLDSLVGGLNTQLDYLGGGTTSKTIYLCWKWDYSDVDTTDTTLGITGTASPSVTIGCSVTQVD